MFFLSWILSYSLVKVTRIGTALRILRNWKYYFIWEFFSLQILRKWKYYFIWEFLPCKSLESESITSFGIFRLANLRRWKYSFIWNVCLYMGFSHIHLRSPGNWKYSFIWDFRLYLGFSPFPLVNGQQRNQGGSDRRTDEPDPPTFHGPKGFFSAFHGIFQVVS